MKTIAMIPARIGSTRLKMKNLALIDGKPMIAYAIEAARNSGMFERVVVNSDHEVFQDIAKRFGADFYLRSKHLGSSSTKSDDVVLDFIQQNPSEIVAWVNSISPLQTAGEIKQIIEYFKKENLDSLITVKDEQVHTTYNGQPINFDLQGKFAQTQDLMPVRPFVYSIMMWKTEPFIEAMKSQGYAFFTGKVGYYPVGKLASIIVKTEQDLKLAEFIVKAQKANDPLQYDKVAQALFDHS